MSISSVSIIIDRIKSAPVSNPIAVFKLSYPDGKTLEAVFGNTVITKKRIDDGCNLFVGNFHSDMDNKYVASLLKIAAKE